MFTGELWKISDRYANLLNVIFLMLMYCGSIPILIPLAALSCICKYWVRPGPRLSNIYRIAAYVS
jgi:hypothetical protein